MFSLRRSVLIMVAFMATAILATSGTVKAQQTDAEVWYWAYNDSQIIAYTADGKSNVIYEAEGAFVDSQLEGLRLSSDRAWLLDNYNQDFPPLLDPYMALSLSDGIYPQSYEHPYLVLTQGGPTIRKGFVYNVETQEIRQLTDWLVANYFGYDKHQKPQFLADGHTLRYYSVKENSAPEWDEGTLRELDLTTGNETTLLNIPFLATDFYASEDGEQWWFPKGSFDGDYEAVMTFGPPNPQITSLMKNGDGYFRMGHLVVYDLHSGNAALSLYPLSGEAPITYNAPTNQLDFSYLYLDGRLLVGDDFWQQWLLSPQSDPIPLGAVPLPMIDDIEYRYSGDGEFSADGRWVITRGWETSLYQLWDMEQGIIVLEESVDPELMVAQYTAERVLLRKRNRQIEISGEVGILYLAEERRIIYLPDAPTGRWWDILPDGRLLYEEEPTSEIRTPGIYIYDVATEEFTPLLLNVKHIWLRRDFDR
ncbi:MAG: hypothetical protein HY862_06930 [Chloroflexi bacterium]|nr:hypothetical protein [Chloroflexota bacterium]